MIKDGWQEVSPGSKRRWEPEGGISKHNERIHKESKQADNKNLPFSFRKPNKPLGRSMEVVCPYCSKICSINDKTTAVICGSCKKFFKIS